VVLVGDFNKKCDAMLLSYPLKQVIRSLHVVQPSSTKSTPTYLIGMSDLPSCRISVGRSDHHAVVMAPMHKTAQCEEDVKLVVRSQDPNGRALLAQAIWTGPHFTV